MPKGPKHCIPILRVKDARASIEYYAKTLGFGKDWEHQFEAGLPLFVSITRDASTLFLSEHEGDGTPNTHVYLYVGDVNSLYEELKARGARIAKPPQMMPWGVQEMIVEDLDGNVLRFGKDIEGD